MAASLVIAALPRNRCALRLPRIPLTAEGCVGPIAAGTLAYLKLCGLNTFMYQVH
jgi:hypothetical protein